MNHHYLAHTLLHIMIAARLIVLLTKHAIPTGFKLIYQILTPSAHELGRRLKNSLFNHHHHSTPSKTARAKRKARPGRTQQQPRNGKFHRSRPEERFTTHQGDTSRELNS
jgi:hypothetical protein